MEFSTEKVNKTADMKRYTREYSQEYRKIHKNDEKIKCEICGYYYAKINRSHHYKSNRHELAELRSKMNQVKNIL